MASRRDGLAATDAADVGRSVKLKISGGGALKSYLREVANRVGGGKAVRVGFLEGADYPPNHPVRGTPQQVQPVAQVAFFNEFGTKRAPPRPFFRSMIADKSPEWGPALGMALKRTDYNGMQSLKLLGEGISDQLRTSIQTFSDPPNAPATVAIKGFNAPLRDSEIMARAVDYEVVKG